MADSLITRPSLLFRIREAQDREAWRQFLELYAPMVYGFARKRGLQDADAADVVQDVLQQVASSVRHLEYDPKRGSFRSWLYRVTRNRLHKFWGRQRPGDLGRGDTAIQDLLEQQPAEEDTALWDSEYEQHVFAWAVRHVRPEFEDRSWQAFWQSAYEGKPPAEVARLLGISVGAVYIAKSRIMTRLVSKIQELRE